MTPDETTSSSSAGQPLLTREFAGILITQLAFGYSLSSFQMLPTFLTVECGASASQLGFVTAAYGVTAVIATPLMGDLVDRMGRRQSVASGALLMLLTSLAFAAVEELGPLVYILRALQGVAFGMAFIGGSTMAMDQAPPERLGQTLGLFGLTMLSMNAVGPVVTEELAGRVGWPVAFAVAAAGAGICLLLALIRRDGAPPAQAHGNGASLWEIARRPRQLRIATVVVLAAAACGVMFTFHQPYAIELGFERVGSFFAAYAIAGIAVRVLLGHLIDRAGRHRVAVANLALYGCAVTAMANLESFGLVLLGAAFGFAHGLFFPAFNAIALQEIPERERNRAMALFIGAFNLGFAGGPFALGFLADARGLPLVFLVTGGISFAALALLLASPESRQAQGLLAARGAAPAEP